MSTSSSPPISGQGLKKSADGPLHDLLNKLRKSREELRKFWRTRRAVLGGTGVEKMQDDELENAGLMTSWKFNIYESFAASVPALVAKTFLDFLYPPYKAEGIQAEVNSVFAWLWPVAVPFILLLTAKLFAWGSLKRADSSTENKLRARRGYLYMDGAYSIFPQALLSLSVVLASVGFERSPLDTALGGLPSGTVTNGRALAYIHLLGLFTFTVAGMWEVILKRWIISRKLMALNGYSSRFKWFWMIKDKGRNFGPWNKFVFAAVYALSLITTLLGLIVLAFSWGIGFVLFWIKHVHG